MSPRHSIGILLAAISFASAQDLPHPTRLLTNPVQPPGFSDDPALTTPRPLLIITPPEVIYGDPGSTSDNTLTPETTIPYQAELPLETDGPIEATTTITTTTTITPEVPSTSSSPFVTSTSFPPTPLPTAAITTTSSTTSSATTTATAATEATTDDAEAQVAATSVDLSPLPFIDSRFEKRSAVSSMANPASMPTAFTSAAAGLIAIVGLAMAL